MYLTNWLLADQKLFQISAQKCAVSQGLGVLVKGHSSDALYLCRVIEISERMCEK